MYFIVYIVYIFIWTYLYIYNILVIYKIYTIYALYIYIYIHVDIHEGIQKFKDRLREAVRRLQFHQTNFSDHSLTNQTSE